MIDSITLELDDLRKFNIDEMEIDILINHVKMSKEEIEYHISKQEHGYICPYLKREWIE